MSGRRFCKARRMNEDLASLTAAAISLVLAIFAGAAALL
jgi:hypothetical protein